MGCCAPLLLAGEGCVSRVGDSTGGGSVGGGAGGVKAGISLCAQQEGRCILCPFVPGRLIPGAEPAVVGPCGQGEGGWQGPGCQHASGSGRRLLLRRPFPCREKLVNVAVELLSTEVAEKALVVVTLRLLAVFMAKYDCRVPFATEGGVRAVLACMQQHASSALVQQAGLAVSVAEGMPWAGGQGAGSPRCGGGARCPPDCC